MVCKKCKKNKHGKCKGGTHCDCKHGQRPSPNAQTWPINQIAEAFEVTPEQVGGTRHDTNPREYTIPG